MCKANDMFSNVRATDSVLDNNKLNTYVNINEPNSHKKPNTNSSCKNPPAYFRARSVDRSNIICTLAFVFC